MLVTAPNQARDFVMSRLFAARSDMKRQCREPLSQLMLALSCEHIPNMAMHRAEAFMLL